MNIIFDYYIRDNSFLSINNTACEMQQNRSGEPSCGKREFVSMNF